MQLKNFIFENGSFVLFIAFSLSLFVWFLALIFLFDYVDYGVYKPAYVCFGWLFALVAGFILLVISGVLSLFKVKTPKVFAVVGLLLILINVYDAASIIIYVHTTPLEDNVPITTPDEAVSHNNEEVEYPVDNDISEKDDNNQQKFSQNILKGYSLLDLGLSIDLFSYP